MSSNSRIEKLGRGVASLARVEGIIDLIEVEDLDVFATAFKHEVSLMLVQRAEANVARLKQKL